LIPGKWVILGNMRLLPGYVTAPSPGLSVVVHGRVTQAATAAFVDAAFEVLPTRTIRGQAAVDLMRARTAIQSYSSVYTINEPSTGRLNVFA
jgi:hypothetical protein